MLWHKHTHERKQPHALVLLRCYLSLPPWLKPVLCASGWSADIIKTTEQDRGTYGKLVSSCALQVPAAVALLRALHGLFERLSAYMLWAVAVGM